MGFVKLRHECLVWEALDYRFAQSPELIEPNLIESWHNEGPRSGRTVGSPGQPLPEVGYTRDFVAPSDCDPVVLVEKAHESTTWATNCLGNGSLRNTQTACFGDELGKLLLRLPEHQEVASPLSARLNPRRIASS